MSAPKTLCVVCLVACLAPALTGAPAKPRPKAPAPPVPTVADVIKGIDYRSIGPTRQSGRFVDFAVPLQQPRTFYAATGSGGLWKTTNNGQSFEPIFDNEKVISIGDVAVAPSDPNVLWVGTGEANNSRSTYWGDGVYKSTDAGKTWTNMGLRDSHHIGRIVVHPTVPGTVYVAALGHLYTDNAERGVFKTTDGGKTWVKSLEVIVAGRNVGCVDLAMDPANPDVLYAAAYDRMRRPWTYQVGGPGSGIYKTMDAGKTWVKLAGGLPEGILGRIGLAVYAKNPSILYAMVENANKPGISVADRWQEILDGKSSQGMTDGEVYRSEDAGATWRRVSPDKRNIGGAPGYYYGQIVVDPTNDQNVFVLSVGVFGSRDGGKTWVSAFRFGGDNHALWIDPADPAHMLLGYDHGMGLTWDAGKTWDHPDFLPLAQFYAIDFDMSLPYRVAGGLQDNGSLMGPSTKKGTAGSRDYDFEGTSSGVRGGPPIRLEDWFTVGGGDGMYNVFDRRTNRYLYNEYQFGPLLRTDLVTGETKDIAYQSQKPETRWNWCSPVLVSAHNSDTVYHCGNIVVMSANRGETWTEVSPDLTTNDKSKLPVEGKGGDQSIQYCTITAFDESPLVPGLLWAGTDDGNVWVTRDNGRNWAKLNGKITGNPGYWVSRVAASAVDPGTAYVCYTGFRNDDFRPFIYKTTDYGQTWTSVAGDLAEGPVNVVREDPRNANLLFAGTDFGVYVSIDGGRRWTKMKNNMPTQPVHDLKIQPREHDLIVATHGRGLYIADVEPLEELTPQVLAEEAHLFSVKSKVRWAGFNRANSSSSNYAGRSEPTGIVVNYYLRVKPKGEVKIQVFKGRFLVNEVNGTADPGLNSAVWNMTGRRERTPEEKRSIQEQAKRAQETGSGRRFAGDLNYASFPAVEGEYSFVLVVDGKTYTASASILKDEWYKD
ncbi:MAG TPA: hypothetical protein VMS75_12575 [Terriglobales bacterium]|nr:hypothetical protein [Terriglobales bacterium]